MEDEREYIYDADYLKKECIDFDTLDEDLKKIPYGFIEKVGSIRFMNQVEGFQDIYEKVPYSPACIGKER